jgi:drug/metabolite transporter (DMT)-like permease
VAAAVVAVLAALCYALCTICQHRTVTRSPDATGLAIGLVWQLGHRPLWLVGVLAGGAGLALQALALSMGQLVVVQPLLVTGMMIAIPASLLLDRRPPRPREWAYASVVVLGLVVFLLAARPEPGALLAADGMLVMSTVASAVCLIVVVALALGVGGRHRAWLLGLAAGMAFGLASALLKQVVGELAAPYAYVFTSWPFYAVLVVGGAGVVLAQVGYQAGSLTTSQPALTIAEPVVAALIGWLAFGEQLAVGPVARIGQLTGLALLSVGVLRLTVLTGPGMATTPSRRGETPAKEQP